jgi:hypothetical protein
MDKSNGNMSTHISLIQNVRQKECISCRWRLGNLILSDRPRTISIVRNRNDSHRRREDCRILVGYAIIDIYRVRLEHRSNEKPVTKIRTEL